MKYLEFDYSEDADCNGTFDAVASVGESRWHELRAEVGELLRWAEQHWGARVPLDEGGCWDASLEAVHESVQPLTVDVDSSWELFAAPVGEAQSRYTLSVTLCGSSAFCASLRERFGLDV